MLLLLLRRPVVSPWNYRPHEFWYLLRILRCCTVHRRKISSCAEHDITNCRHISSGQRIAPSYYSADEALNPPEEFNGARIRRLYRISPFNSLFARRNTSIIWFSESLKAGNNKFRDHDYGNMRNRARELYASHTHTHTRRRFHPSSANENNGRASSRVLPPTCRFLLSFVFLYRADPSCFRASLKEASNPRYSWASFARIDARRLIT